MQETDWERTVQLSSLEKSYAEKHNELTKTDASHEPIQGSPDQLLTREEVGLVTQRYLGNMIDTTKRKIEQNIKGQELNVDFVSEKIKILTNKQLNDSLPPSRKSLNTSN